MISKPSPTAIAHRLQARHVLADMRLADLDLGALEAGRLRRQRLAHQVVGRQVQPAAFRRVDGDALLRAAGRQPQRLAVAAAAPVPQRGVDSRQRKAGDRADAGGVRREHQLAPDRLDLRRVLADQPRRQVVAQQRHHRRSSRADGVAVADALAAVVTDDAHERRFLRHEGLDRVAARHRRRQVDVQQVDGGDARHARARGSPALRAGSRPVLGLTARRETRCAHCVRCARTIATSQKTKRARARGRESLRSSAPHMSLPSAHPPTALPSTTVPCLKNTIGCINAVSGHGGERLLGGQERSDVGVVIFTGPACAAATARSPACR